ncbi:MAG: flagellar motor protein MotB [Syntrophales bacterium]|jgi:chemotaxis protein MotB|nr:flagellar motor protein MotB [Syntrophales bacterium]
MNRRVDDPGAASNGKWLITFNDMITLLLTFFVLILSMSTLEKTKTAGIADSARKVVGAEASDVKARREEPKSITSSLQDKDIESVKRKKENGESPDDPVAGRRNVVAGRLENIDGVKTTPTQNGLFLSLNEKFLFPSGSADISEKGAKILETIAEILSKANVSVRVEGHTDATPIYSSKYPSNWELSMARAARVVRWLAESGEIAPESLSAAGYADTRPAAPNDSELNRQANRRVDIVLTFLKL